MKTTVLFVVLAFAGCGEGLPSPATDRCAFPDNTRLTFQDCGVVNGVRRVAACTITPLDGSPSWQMPAGCVVYPGTTDEGTCEDSCSPLPFRYYDCGTFTQDGRHCLMECTYSDGAAVTVGSTLGMNGPEQGLCLASCQGEVCK